MKKTICIILACFLLFVTPIKGYAVSAPLVFGLGEEVILPFLLSLLGVQSVNQIESYEDLVSYNDEVYDSLIESLSGLVGFEAVQAWLLKAVQGTIETNSIIWQKLYELALDNYVARSASAGINVNYSGGLGNWEFTFYSSGILTYYSSVNNGYYSTRTYDKAVRVSSTKYLFATGDPTFRQTGNTYNPRGEVIDTYTGLPANQGGSYTYDNKTVYYGTGTFGNVRSFEPDMTICADMDKGQVAWLAVYGDYSAHSENIAEYSGAYDLALSAQQKEDIIDGTSVIQLYNPADEQNGLHFVPDPDEPDDIKIPFAVTADWWNYLKQFGNDAKEQVVQAYNALNGLNGNSIGSISDAYDRLGIASVLSTAQSAAEGIASLTDSNVYPNSLTVADTINNSIPSSLIPESPDSGIDNESEQGLYKLPDLRDYFPFCIPFDLIDLLSCFVAEPETPSFVIALSTGEETVSGNMDLHIWDNIAGVIRTFELIGFTVGLILITRNIIRG